MQQYFNCVNDRALIGLFLNSLSQVNLYLTMYRVIVLYFAIIAERDSLKFAKILASHKILRL